MIGIMYKEPLVDGLTITPVPDHIFGYELVPVKTHKKKRINKKYLKKYGYKKVVPFKLFVFAYGIFCPKSHYDKMVQRIANDSEILNSIKRYKFISDNNTTTVTLPESGKGIELPKIEREKLLNHMDSGAQNMNTTDMINATISVWLNSSSYIQ